MQAIILAAGMGKRLKELTKNKTKCMICVNGVTLIERMLRQLDEKNLSRIIIVKGYEGEKLEDFIKNLDVKTPIIFVENPIYNKTNNIYSLSLVKNELCEEDTLLFESDLIFDDEVLSLIIKDKRDSLALVDRYESWMDGTCVKIDEYDNIEKFVSKEHFKYSEIKNYYKTVNIYKFSKQFSKSFYVPFLEAYQNALGKNEYYEQVLGIITLLDNPGIKAERLNGQKWYEIDDIQDLDIAESIFSDDDSKRVDLMKRRYGGYWRYPQILDFCYLVNPYFPTEKLKDEIRANFDVLLTEYPSGMSVNSLLAAKNFGVSKEYIIVGNGAAELIKELMRRLKGTTGFIRPSFDEYINRYDNLQEISYWPVSPDYAYSVDDIMDFFGEKHIDNLVVVNPDNPSGNYLNTSDVTKLICWADEKGIKLILDESFSDFADEDDNSFIKMDILEKYKNLYIIKSISKSYGVPGLRLGILASSDVMMINEMKKNVSIWNINSFAEFYMQIQEKYNNDYNLALEQFRCERTRFCAELEKVKGIRVIPSQANYVMVEIKSKLKARDVQRILLVKYNILVKELFDKTKKDLYLRLAVRNSSDNNVLINALKEILGANQ